MKQSAKKIARSKVFVSEVPSDHQHYRTEVNAKIMRMKLLMMVVCLFFCRSLFSQKLELHYDFRHTIDPKRNAKNFPELYFEYFKVQDSGKHFIKPGSFLLKTEADFQGEKSNIGKFYIQVSQSFRFWKPKIFLNLQYSGGLGVTQPVQYSYYIANAYCAGLNYPFKWGDAFMTAVLNYQYLSYKKPSNDALFTLYWYKGLHHYKMEFSGDFSVWTANKNQGDSLTQNLHGKRFYFFAEPQFWLNLNKTFALGTKMNMNYHVLTNENIFQIYPTVAIRCKL